MGKHLQLWHESLQNHWLFILLEECLNLMPSPSPDLTSHCTFSTSFPAYGFTDLTATTVWKIPPHHFRHHHRGSARPSASPGLPPPWSQQPPPCEQLQRPRLRSLSGQFSTSARILTCFPRSTLSQGNSNVRSYGSKYICQEMSGGKRLPGLSVSGMSHFSHQDWSYFYRNLILTCSWRESAL